MEQPHTYGGSYARVGDRYGYRNRYGDLAPREPVPRGVKNGTLLTSDIPLDKRYINTPGMAHPSFNPRSTSGSTTTGISACEGGVCRLAPPDHQYDPRLVDNKRGSRIPIDSAPFDPMYRRPDTPNRVHQRYEDIKDGQILYYTSESQDPFQDATVSRKGTVVRVATENPASSKPQYHYVRVGLDNEEGCPDDEVCDDLGRKLAKVDSDEINRRDEYVERILRKMNRTRNIDPAFYRDLDL